jgi:hypothetical protein
VVIQSVGYVPEQRKDGIPVLLDQLMKSRPCSFWVITIRIVEVNIFIFQPAKRFQIRVYLEKEVLYLRKIKIISQLVVEARRGRIPAVIRIGKDNPLEVLNKVIFF